MRSATRPLTPRRGFRYPVRATAPLCPGRLATAMPTISGCWLIPAPSMAARWSAGPWLVPAAGQPSISAWFRAAGRAANADKWPAANQAATRRAEPVTAAAVTRAGLFRSAGAPGADFRLFWAAAPRGADVDREGFRCLGGVRDTIDFPWGAGNALSYHPAAGLVHPIASGVWILCGVRATRSLRHHTLVAVVPPGCTTRPYRRAGTTQETGAATPCRSLAERRAARVSPCR